MAVMPPLRSIRITRLQRSGSRLQVEFSAPLLGEGNLIAFAEQHGSALRAGSRPIVLTSEDRQTWVADGLWATLAEEPRIVGVLSLRMGSYVLDLGARRRLFLETRSGEWDSGQMAIEEAERRRSSRDDYYGLQLGEATESSKTFQVLMIADNLLLSRSLRVPGLQVFPFETAMLGNDLGIAINGLARQVGWGGLVPHEAMAKMSHAKRPEVAIFAPAVHADSPQEANLLAVDAAQRILDVLAYRRGSVGRLLCSSLAEVEPEAGRSPVPQHLWIAGRDYGGNYVPGLLSGEGQAELSTLWERSGSDPQFRLWVSLYAEAIGDDRWEYRFFRCFNLIEAIAADRYPRKQKVLDESGRPLLMEDGDAYTTDQARGKVYQLLRDISTASNLNRNFFVTSVLSGEPPSLWNDVGVWVKVRNEIAHRGTWRLPTGAAPSARRRKLETELRRRGYEDTVDDGIEVLLRNAREAAEWAIHSGSANNPAVPGDGP